MEWSPPDLPTTSGIRPSGMAGADATDEFEDGYESIDSQDKDVLLRIDERIQEQRKKVLRYYRQARFAEWRLQDLERIRRQHAFSSRCSRCRNDVNEAGIPETACPIAGPSRQVFKMTAEVAAFVNAREVSNDAIGLSRDVVSDATAEGPAGDDSGQGPRQVSGAVVEGNIAVLDVTAEAPASQTEVSAEVLTGIVADETGVSAEALTTAAAEGCIEVVGVPEEDNIFKKAFCMDIECRDRSEDEVANLELNGIKHKDYTFTRYEYKLLLQESVPERDLSTYYCFMTDPAQNDPETHSCVHFRGLVKGISECEFLEHFVSFNGLLSEEYQKRAVIAVKCVRMKHDTGNCFFNGLVYVTYATRFLAELAIEFWNNVVFQALEPDSLQVYAGISTGSIRASQDQSIPGAARFNEHVFEYCGQQSLDSRVCNIPPGTIGFPASIMKVARRY